MSRSLRLAVVLVLSFCFAIVAGCDSQLWNTEIKASQLSLVTPSDPATFNYAMNTSL